MMNTSESSLSLLDSARLWYEETWSRRDIRMDEYIMMSSVLPTFMLCLSYVISVTIVGPRLMKNREPMDLRKFLVFYNLFQVLLSTYIFYEIAVSGWMGHYNLFCQPVDYSHHPRALRMARACWLYYMSKFTEFLDTFCFVARKRFRQVSLLHVVHHGLMPLSVWPGARFVPGGHASFFGLLNSFVHIIMYLYYLISALGPKYNRFIWWKRHMTSFQMIQFIAIMVHGFQLVFYDNCQFPWQFAYYIGAHALMFFGLFANFYLNEYLRRGGPKMAATGNGCCNGSTKKLE